MTRQHPQERKAIIKRGGQRRPTRRFVLACWGLAAAILVAAGCAKDTDTPSPDSNETEQAEQDEALASVELGEFHIREQRPIENHKIDVHFAVQAAVSEQDQERFERLVDARQNTLRDQIILAIRTAESPEFDEPQLDKLRLRILLRIADVLGERLVNDLYVTDFRCQID